MNSFYLCKTNTFTIIFIIAGARIDILKEKNVFQGLFFTTSDMQASVKAWPEIIFFDGTYKLLMHSLIVILFLVEDGNFLTELAAVAIVRREDQSTIDWVMNCFAKHHHESVEKIRYFMCDKNATQRQSIRKIFSHAILLICLFLTVQIFKRTISSAKGLSPQLKVISLEKLTMMAYAENDEIYQRRLKDLVKNCTPSVLEYFFKNWDPIKNEWTCYNNYIGTFCNRTNNRTESINQKLKQIIDKLSNLFQAITLFFTWKKFHDQKNKQKIIHNFGSELPRCFNEDEKEYVNLLMNGPFDIVLKELQHRIYIHFDIINETDNIFRISKTNRVTTTDMCNCNIYTGYRLPCRHIFAVRNLLKLKLFNEQLCEKRWTKKYCFESHRVFMKNETSKHPITLCEKVHCVKDEIELRLIKITEIISDLIDVCSCSCGNKFYEQIALLTDLMDVWSQDQNVTVVTRQRTSELINANDFEAISRKLQMMNLNITKKTAILSVPEKRRIVDKALENLYTMAVKAKSEIFQRKLIVLEKIREGWIHNKCLKIHQQEGLTQIVTSKSTDQLKLPKSYKVVGKPRKALITNIAYKKKTKKNLKIYKKRSNVNIICQFLKLD